LPNSVERRRGFGPVGAEKSSLLVRALWASHRVVAVLGSVPRFVRLVFARIGLLTLSGDRRDAEILALGRPLAAKQRTDHNRDDH
jgi:hypothetical protein